MAKKQNILYISQEHIKTYRLIGLFLLIIIVYKNILQSNTIKYIIVSVLTIGGMRMDNQIRNVLGEIVIVNKKAIKLLSNNIQCKELSVEQFFLLSRIVSQMSQKCLAKILHISEATLSVRISRLEKNGYVIREVNPNDKRYYNLKVSDKGKKLLDENFEVIKNTMASIFEGIQDEDFEYILSLLNKLKSNIERGEQDA